MWEYYPNLECQVREFTAVVTLLAMFAEAATVDVILEMAAGAAGGFLYLPLGWLCVAGFALQVFMCVGEGEGGLLVMVE